MLLWWLEKYPKSMKLLNEWTGTESPRSQKPQMKQEIVLACSQLNVRRQIWASPPPLSASFASVGIAFLLFNPGISSWQSEDLQSQILCLGKGTARVPLNMGCILSGTAFHGVRLLCHHVNILPRWTKTSQAERQAASLKPWTFIHTTEELFPTLGYEPACLPC